MAEGETRMMLDFNDLSAVLKLDENIANLSFLMEKLDEVFYEKNVMIGLDTGSALILNSPFAQSKTFHNLQGDSDE